MILKNAINVAHPNIQHSLHLALALQKSQMLNSYYTRLYCSWNHFPFSMLKWLPKEYLSMLDKWIFDKVRRRHLELDDSKIIVRTNDALLVLGIVLLQRIGVITTKKMRELLYYTSNSFQDYVAEITKNQNVTAIICYSRFAYDTFIKLYDSDIKLILDLPTTHPNLMEKIINVEGNAFPQYSEAILKVSGITGIDIKRACEEINMADYILAGSSFVRRSCIENGISPNKIFVVPYGTNLYQFNPDEKLKDERRFRILYVGRISPLKGVHYLVKAFAELSLPNSELWLCGDGKEINTIIPSSINNIKYFGTVNYIDLPNIYKQADLFVFPSLFDGFGQVILEAMASGLPVIATTNSGGPDVIQDGENGFVVPIRNVEVLKEKILYIYENSDIASNMGVMSRQIAIDYNWQRYEKQLADTLSKL